MGFIKWNRKPDWVIWKKGGMVSSIFCGELRDVVVEGVGEVGIVAVGGEADGRDE